MHKLPDFCSASLRKTSFDVLCVYIWLFSLIGRGLTCAVESVLPSESTGGPSTRRDRRTRWAGRSGCRTGTSAGRELAGSTAGGQEDAPVGGVGRTSQILTGLTERAPPAGAAAAGVGPHALASV